MPPGSDSIEIRPLTRHIGAEVRGLDLSGAVDDVAFETLHAALLEYQVVFAPEQFLAPPDLIGLATRFGPLSVNPVSPKVEGFAEVTELVTYDGRAPDIWHFDTSFTEAPPAASLLSMVETPNVGGDTLWVSGYALYESLSLPMQHLVETLTVLYDFGVMGPEHITAAHPLVRVHPETGRRSLYFDPMYATQIVELNRAERDGVLAFLRSWVADPTFACRYHWSPGTFAMWDNRCTIHRVSSDFIGRRVIQRVTVAGDVPIGPPSHSATTIVVQ